MRAPTRESDWRYDDGGSRRSIVTRRLLRPTSNNGATRDASDNPLIGRVVHSAASSTAAIDDRPVAQRVLDRRKRVDVSAGIASHDGEICCETGGGRGVMRRPVVLLTAGIVPRHQVKNSFASRN